MGKAPLSYVGISWFREADYDAALAIMQDPGVLPGTYAEWLARAEAQISKAESLGYLVVRAVIDPKTFADWCSSRGLNVDANARRAFAEAEVRRKVTKF